MGVSYSQFLKDSLKNKEFIIFGTGKSAQYFLEIHELSPIFFVDNNSKRWGDSFMEKPIYSPDELLTYQRSAIILIASSFENEISQQLSTMGFKKNENFYNIKEYLFEINTKFLQISSLENEIDNFETVQEEVIYKKLIPNTAKASSNFVAKEELSFSQAGEDKICHYIIQRIPYLNSPTYLDLGINHPKNGSNTYYFYNLGYSGILVRDDSISISDLSAYRPRDIVLNNCISTVSVNEIMECYFASPPTILNIDIAGEDSGILKSIDFNKHRPTVVITKIADYKNALAAGVKDKDILSFMEVNDYIEFAFTGISSLFVDKIRLGGSF